MLDQTTALTVAEVAARLHVSPETVKRWLRRKQLHGVRLGGTRAGWRVMPAEVARVLRDGLDSPAERPSGDEPF